ncbi:MAG: hypothetical protein J6X55_17595 [Victivallales bacterium]|nr:hypothetical protein [Victivallales bacterium]
MAQKIFRTNENISFIDIYEVYLEVDGTTKTGGHVPDLSCMDLEEFHMMNCDHNPIIL